MQVPGPCHRRTNPRGRSAATGPRQGPARPVAAPSVRVQSCDLSRPNHRGTIMRQAHRLARHGWWTLVLVAMTAQASGPPQAGESYRIDPASVRRFGPAYRYPQAGWVVLHIEGQPYERGYQHGRLLAAEIADLIKSLANYQSPKAPADG